MEKSAKGPQEPVASAGDEEAGADGLNIALRSPFDWSAIQAFLEEVLPVFHQG